jgi:ergothioneine biosynthesis protein EgtB
MASARPAAQVNPAPLDERLRAARALSLELAAPLSPEDCQVQSMPDASPVKWHLAHTTWFFETFVLEPHLPGYRAFRPQFRQLFNSYYHSVSEQYPRPRRGLLTRPSLDEVRAWRVHVDEGLARLWACDPPDEVRALLELGLSHEQQHQELLLTDIKHAFAVNPLRPAYGAAAPRAVGEAPAAGWSRQAGGVVEIGHAGAGFCFDNETPRHAVLLRPFELATRPVTNGEYRDFVRDGGYRSPQWWLSDGWATLQAEGWSRPLYWSDDGARVFTLAGEQALPADEPVSHLSYYEADAFARWAGARLPREAEWEAVAAGLPVEGNFLDLARLHPLPAAATPGVRQMFGDVWEWTQSAYQGYPGYRAPRGAVGEYNGKFMCNQLVLRGGSCATPPGHARASYRNFFAPAARWQFAGVRLARDA